MILQRVVFIDSVFHRFAVVMRASMVDVGCVFVVTTTC